MRIGLFTDSFLPVRDGVATSVASCAQEFKRKGHTVYVVAPRYPHFKDQKNVFRLFSLRIFEKPEIWIGLEIPQPSLFKVLFLPFDIIHAHSGGFISIVGLQIARIRNIPFIITYHTLWKYYSHYFIFPKILKPWMFKKLNAFMGNVSDAVIAPTEKVRLELLKSGVKKPIYVIPSGVDLEKFSGQKKGFLHNKFNLSGKLKILLSIGRLEKEKSVEFLITSFARAAITQPNLVLVLVGEGRNREKAKLQRLVHSLGIDRQVCFAGIVPFSDMPKVYKDADLFIFASHTETQGMVLIESLASGVPVLTVSDSAFEGVVENGVNGYMVEKDVNVFAGKIIELMRNTDHRWKLARNAVKLASKFSIQNTTLKLEEVYSVMLRKNNNNLDEPQNV